MLDGIELDVGAGEVVAVLGASGSGKSTLLRCVCGLHEPAGGSVEWNGESLTTLAPHRRDIGMMFQGQALFPHLDVAHNVEFGLRSRRVDRAARRRRVEAMLELVGLADFGGRRVATLSGGEQQRVALARALAPQPRALLLDEPFGALDRALRERLVLDVAAILRSSGVAAILVTHDQDEAATMADRIGVLDGGRLVQVASPFELWSRPSTPAVGALLGFVGPVSGYVGEGRIETPWGVLEADDQSPRRPVEIVVRPDALVVEPVDAEAGDDTPGRTLLGSVVRSVPRAGGASVELRIGDGPPITARRERPLEAGTTVAVRVRREGLFVF